MLAIVTPNGTLGELTTPRGSNWVGFRVDLEHMQYLHVDTVDYLGRSLHCRIVHLEQYGFRPLDNVLASLGPEPRPMAVLSVRRFIKNIPGMRRAIYAFHDLRSLVKSIGQPLRDSGDYHLFAVLQKMANA